MKTVSLEALRPAWWALPGVQLWSVYTWRCGDDPQTTF